MMSRVNGFYAARTIESVDPTFKNSLINYLDLRKRRNELSKSTMAAIEAKAVKDLTRVEIDTVVNQRRLLQTAYALSAIVVVFCLYAFITPKSILDSAKRAFLADVVRPTNTQLVEIKPGDDKELARVVSGANVPFSVNIKGARPSKVKLHYSVDGGKYYSVSEFTPGEGYYDSWRTTLRDVRQSMQYYLTGGDAESLKYHLEVVPAPMVTSVTVDYEFPSYTGVPPRNDVEGGTIKAIEGTLVTIHARTNEPAVSGHIDFSRAKTMRNEQPILDVASEDPRLLEGRFTIEQSGSYTIKFKTTGGQVNPDPVVYDIISIPDNPPTEVAFLKPEKTEITVPSNVSVPILATALDDFGIKEAMLRVYQGNENLYTVDLLEKQKPVRRFKGTFDIDLAAKKVKPGTRLEYWLTVRDTKEPGPPGPSPPSARSSRSASRSSRRRRKPSRRPASRSGKSSSVSFLPSRPIPTRNPRPTPPTSRRTLRSLPRRATRPTLRRTQPNPRMGPRPTRATRSSRTRPTRTLMTPTEPIPRPLPPRIPGQARQAQQADAEPAASQAGRRQVAGQPTEQSADRRQPVLGHELAARRKRCEFLERPRQQRAPERQPEPDAQPCGNASSSFERSLDEEQPGPGFPVEHGPVVQSESKQRQPARPTQSQSQVRDRHGQELQR